ncbi:alcohol acetyltransferase domain-containing protein [Penicillium subrubescens]|uniref:Alcohol acetyltransferase FCK4 n=1 Tax=Penicillium subrubescens TaxID=1316194 RepID=A0A1Q5UD15_9EURO|nr:alcohol acetyltransferase domain-containing protein [Penicillium subrubescens]KAJ5883741.1 alcohol acetyltransferase domain-containing protein [Penicillium subrubescens]OKP10349.1 hypothetical protein PENSUB_4196 [Penicillium subrubescens]
MAVVRSLGCVESYQIALQRLDLMRGIILACRYTLPAPLVLRCRQSELISVFERAVARVVLKHPTLHVGLVGEDTDKPCWIRLDQLDLGKHIEWHTEPVRQTQLLDARFTDYQTTPGWKVTVVRSGSAGSIEVILVFNHTNLDGRSAMIFHTNLLQSLQDDRPDLAGEMLLQDHILTLPPESSAMLAPPPELIVQFPVHPNAMRQFLNREVHTPTAQYPRVPTQAHWAPIRATPFQTQSRRITVPRHHLSRLIHACRSHQTTLTGLLHALIAVSLAPLLDFRDAPALSSLTAMDLRRFLPSRPASHPWFRPEEGMSNYVTLATHTFDEHILAQIRESLAGDQLVGPGKDSPFKASPSLVDLIWTTAAQVRKDLEGKLAQGTTNDMIGFSLAVQDWRAHLGEEVQRPRRTSWVITNLGEIDGLPHGKGRPSALPGPSNPLDRSTWSITDTEFVMGANAVSSAICVALAAVRGGDLVLSCSWQDAAVDVAVAEAVVANLERWLTCLRVIDAGRVDGSEGGEGEGVVGLCGANNSTSG